MEATITVISFSLITFNYKDISVVGRKANYFLQDSQNPGLTTFFALADLTLTLSTAVRVSQSVCVCVCVCFCCESKACRSTGNLLTCNIVNR